MGMQSDRQVDDFHGATVHSRVDRDVLLNVLLTGGGVNIRLSEIRMEMLTNLLYFGGEIIEKQFTVEDSTDWLLSSGIATWIGDELFILPEKPCVCVVFFPHHFLCAFLLCIFKKPYFFIQAAEQRVSSFSV